MDIIESTVFVLWIMFILISKMRMANNMNNEIRKNTKTIFFASLIAALLLPLGVMDSAVAEEQVDVKQKIREMIEELESQQASTQGTAQSQVEDDLVLKKLKIAERLLNVKDNLAEDPTNEKLLEREQKLLKRINNNFDDTPMNQFGEASATTQAYYPTANYQTSDQTRYDCNDNRNETGNIEGTITLVTRESSYISLISNYPDDTGVTDRSGEDCANTNFTDLDVQYRIISGAFTGCADNFTAAELPRVMSCNNIGTDFSPHVVLITTFANYEGNVDFYSTEGWDIVYVG